MKILCKLGIHKWAHWSQYRKHPGHYRKCLRCDRKQKFNKDVNIWLDIWQGL